MRNPCGGDRIARAVYGDGMNYYALMDSAFLDEVMDHFVNLLRLDTSNPPGNEKLVADYLARVFDQENIPYEVVESAPGRANIVARLSIGRPEHGLLLSAHSDVVPADPASFRYPPFSATMADGFIWARGTIDMKYMMAYNLAVMLTVKRHEIPLKRDLVFAAVAGEETGCQYGSLFLAEKHPELVRSEYCLTEMGGLAFEIGKKRFYPIQVAQKGFVWLRVTTRGKQGHGSVLREHYATRDLVAALARLKTGKLGFRLTDATIGMLQGIGRALPMFLGGVLQGLRNERLAGLMNRYLLKDPELSAYFTAALNDTVTITALSGGNQANVVPETAFALLDVRFLPGRSTQDIIAQIGSLLGPGVEIEVLHKAEPYEAPMESELTAAITRAVKRMDPTASTVPYLLSGYTDAIAFQKLGIKTYGFGPLPLPKGLQASSLVHGIDERIPVEGFRFGVSIFVPMVLDFLVSEPQPTGT